MTYPQALRQVLRQYHGNTQLAIEEAIVTRACHNPAFDDRVNALASAVNMHATMFRTRVEECEEAINRKCDRLF